MEIQLLIIHPQNYSRQDSAGHVKLFQNDLSYQFKTLQILIMNQQLTKNSFTNALWTCPKSTNSQTDFSTLRGQNELSIKSPMIYASLDSFGTRQTRYSSQIPHCPMVKLSKDYQPSSKIHDIDEIITLQEDDLIQLSEFNPPADALVQQRQLLSAFYIAEILPQEQKKLLLLEYDEVIIKLFNTEQPNSYEISITEKNKKARKIWVKKRLGLERFLLKLSEVYTICIFTTYSHQLSSQLLNLIDPGQNYIKAHITRDSCKKLNGKLVKDLRVIKNYKLKEIVSVDIQTDRINLQQDNTFLIKKWTGDDEDYMLEESQIYLCSVAKYQDVRVPIKLKFAPSSQIQVWD